MRGKFEVVRRKAAEAITLEKQQSRATMEECKVNVAGERFRQNVNSLTATHCNAVITNKRLGRVRIGSDGHVESQS